MSKFAPAAAMASSTDSSPKEKVQGDAPYGEKPASYVDSRAPELGPDEPHPLVRQLKNRHIAMISIGGK